MEDYISIHIPDVIMFLVGFVKNHYGALLAGMSALWFNPDGHKSVEGVREISSLMQILECL